MNRRVVIDLVPIRVGEGGTGSGIWTYARELLERVDAGRTDGIKILCFANRGQAPFLSNVRNIQVVCFPTLGKNVFFRLVWIHVLLPLMCLRYRVGVLHKLATETPLLCPARRVTTVHDFYYEFLTEQHAPRDLRWGERLEALYFLFVTKICFRKSRAIIAVSEATKQEAVQRFPGWENRVVVVHHGPPCGGQKTEDRRPTPPHAPCPVPHAHIENKVFNILCVAKFMEHKGQHLLIRAFEAFLDANPDVSEKVRLLLRGFHNDQDYFSRIQQQLDHSRWTDRIQIIPFRASDRFADIYRDADLVVLLSSYEGFGLPVLEAQAAGVPVLCSDLPVLREVGGDGAIYVERNNVQAAAREMKRFISDSGFYSAIRKRAVENVDRFSWDRASERTIDVYRSIL